MQDVYNKYKTSNLIQFKRRRLWICCRVRWTKVVALFSFLIALMYIFDYTGCDGRRSTWIFFCDYRTNVTVSAESVETSIKPRIPKLLLLRHRSMTPVVDQLSGIMEQLNLSSDVTYFDRSHVDLYNNSGKPNYDVIVVSDFGAFLSANVTLRALLTRYCQKYNVGMLFFSQYTTETSLRPYNLNNRDDNYKLLVNKISGGIDNFEMNPASDIWKITKPAGPFKTGYMDSHWVSFSPPMEGNMSVTYRPIIYAKQKSNGARVATAMEDLGLLDGVRKVFIGNGIYPKLWAHHLLLLDSLWSLSNGSFEFPLERYIQIDIDGIFSKSKYSTFTRNDAEALLKLQNQMNEHIENFRFNLGFCGKDVDADEHKNEPNYAADYLLAFKDEFYWFPHLYSRKQVNRINYELELETEMNLNKQFALKHNISVLTYAVTPYQAGVYPKIDTLYETWRNVWAVEASSTSVLRDDARPVPHRRGFSFHGVKVIPRIELGLGESQTSWQSVPGGRDGLAITVHGGSKFLDFLYTKFHIERAHASTFAGDQLANAMLGGVTSFISTWTNLRLIGVHPLALNRMYFDENPEEDEMYWQNPCRHSGLRSLWPSSYSNQCERNPFPELILLGPDHPGTNTFLEYLNMHPSLKQNGPIAGSTELNFFSDDLCYAKGIEWYMDQFPKKESIMHILLEMSSSYFRSKMAPRRMNALIPKATLVINLVDPVQLISYHYKMKMESNPVAQRYSMLQMLKARERARHGSESELFRIQSELLEQARYAKHIENWLEYFDPRQIVLINDRQMAYNVSAQLDVIQYRLQLYPIIDFSQLIRYDHANGVYCPAMNADGSVSLKGNCDDVRRFKSDPEVVEYIQRILQSENSLLVRLLRKMNRPLPQWLEYDIDG